MRNEYDIKQLNPRKNSYIQKKPINLKREVNEELFMHILGKIYEQAFDEGEKFENDTFLLMPYDWNDEDANNLENKPNFYHKPSGLKISWYKYPLRSAECNMSISHEDFRSVLIDCLNSTHDGIHKAVKPWWNPLKEDVIQLSFNGKKANIELHGVVKGWNAFFEFCANNCNLSKRKWLVFPENVLDVSISFAEGFLNGLYQHTGDYDINDYFVINHSDVKILKRILESFEIAKTKLE